MRESKNMLKEMNVMERRAVKTTNKQKEDEKEQKQSRKTKKETGEITRKRGKIK